MPFTDFTKPKFPWKVRRSNPPGHPEVGHVIEIGGSEGNATVTCLTDPKHIYQNGTYDEGPPQTISNGSYTITYKPGTPNNQIEYRKPEVTGSWTADDSGSAGGEK
jgi:hypothetical protein